MRTGRPRGLWAPPIGSTRPFGFVGVCLGGFRPTGTGRVRSRRDLRPPRLRGFDGRALTSIENSAEWMLNRSGPVPTKRSATAATSRSVLPDITDESASAVPTADATSKPSDIEIAFP